MKDKKMIFDMLKKRKIKKDQVVILLLLGVLLLVISLPGVKQKENDTMTESGEESSFEGESMTDQEYVSYMEKHLESILSQMKGVGNVTVMITLKESAEKVVEKDVETSNESVSEEDSQGGKRTTANTMLGETTIYKGEDESKEQSPYVSKERTPRVEGVVVVASGGDNAVVIKNITESVQALFGIDTHKIRIVKKE